MTTDVDKVALTIFVAFFLLVTVMGFIAARWRRPKTLARLDEWGLGGRQFGTWITWFLVGGDFYTAYTVIAVPALVYAVGAYGFFALPYTIIVYPFVFAVMPVLWRVAKANGYVTAADVVHGRYGSRALELAVAITGVIATMPYIALQLVGMAAVFKALGLAGELPLVTAFVVLAVYTYSSGLRAPALIAFVKDTMIYIAASFWHGLWVPKGTPKNAIARLNSAVRSALADPVVRQRFADQGQQIPSLEQQSPEALGAHQQAEIKKWWPIIKAAGIKAM